MEVLRLLASRCVKPDVAASYSSCRVMAMSVAEGNIRGKEAMSIGIIKFFCKCVKSQRIDADGIFCRIVAQMKLVIYDYR